MKKKNLLMLVVILTAAYFSINGIMYERAVIENTMVPCCLNNQCNGADCDDPCGMDVPPDEWTGTAMNCADYWDDEVHYCQYNEFCKYYGATGLDCVYPDLTVSISGPTYVDLPLKGSVSTATFTANASGGDNNYTYSWSHGPGVYITGSSTSSSYTITANYTPASFTSSVSVTVTSEHEQTVTVSKTVNFLWRED